MGKNEGGEVEQEEICKNEATGMKGIAVCIG